MISVSNLEAEANQGTIFTTSRGAHDIVIPKASKTFLKRSLLAFARALANRKLIIIVEQNSIKQSSSTAK